MADNTTFRKVTRTTHPHEKNCGRKGSTADEKVEQSRKQSLVLEHEPPRIAYQELRPKKEVEDIYQKIKHLENKR